MGAWDDREGWDLLPRDRWREPDNRVSSEEVAAGDNHRIHRVIFAAVQEARRVRITLWDKNSAMDRFAITEFMVLGEPQIHPRPPYTPPAPIQWPRA